MAAAVATGVALAENGSADCRILRDLEAVAGDPTARDPSMDCIRLPTAVRSAASISSRRVRPEKGSEAATASRREVERLTCSTGSLRATRNVRDS